ncbi:RNA polymerase II-associated protein 1-like [Lineus longissimus]|uniref:RNA polymerase II-associated protein 1-like n=1 Tax=Lineus longissimus TaxID=88925 RepID=UPI002B4EF140
MFTRPKTGESEEDLLKFQEDFLANRINPAALAVKAGEAKRKYQPPRDVVSLDEKPGGTIPPPVKKSKFQQQRQKGRVVSFEEDDPEERLEKHDRHITKVLSEIVERDNRDVVIQQPRQCAGAHGFPSVFHVKAQAQNATGTRKKSLFAQQISKMSPKDLGVSSLPPERKDVTQLMETDASGSDHDGSQAKSSDETSKINQENAMKLSQMTEDEILEEQKHILEMLDPKMVAFLKSKQKVPQSSGPAAAATEPKQTEKQQNASHIKESPKLSLSHSAEDLPVKPKKNWMNMDKIEYDKLEWMKELPKPSADSEKGQQARFDFHGQVVGANIDLPVHMGLHHHGEEPERAGYTLDEIFTLCRSTVAQQRVLALQVLVRILRNAKQGLFIQCLMKPLIPTLLESGLVFLLRWALDDSLEQVQHAAVHAIHALVVDSNDLDGLDKVFSWHQGYEVAMFSPMIEEELSEVADEKLQKTDAEIVKEDLIKGLYQMNLLERLRYILEVCKPPIVVVSDALEIITRIAQHSPEAAYQVYQCPRLLETIFREFLPTLWETESSLVSLRYGCPLSTAMKLMRTICQAGRNMAALLISKYGLMECITRYIAVQPRDLGLPLQEAYQLNTECFRTWSVCMRYSLATDRFSDLYPMLMKTLMQVHMSTLTTDCDECEIKKAVALIGFLEAAMLTAAAGTALLQKISHQPNEEVPAPPAIKWSDIMGILQPIEICANKHMQLFVEAYEEKRKPPAVLSACLHFMASYFSKCQQQPGYNAVECCTYMETMSSSLLLPLLKSTSFRLVLVALRKHSNLLSAETIALKETPASLPGAGSVVQPVDPNQVEAGTHRQCPVISDGSPMNFLTALIRVVYHAGQLHRGITEQLYSRILQNDEVTQYFRRICVSGPSNLAFSFFTKFENLLQYYLLKMAVPQRLGDMKLLHQMALQLFARLHQGDEHLGHDLLSNIIFNKDFIIHGDLDLLDIEHLKLSEVKQLGSATQEDVNLSEKQLLQDATSNLASIRGTYLKSFGGTFNQLMKSRSRALHISHEINSLTTAPVGQALTPKDWMFYPIIALYQRTEKLDRGSLSDQVSPADIGTIADMLKWVLLLECLRPSVVDVVTITTRITRLLCCFIAGSDLFLELPVHCYLCALLRKYCTPARLAKINFEEDIPGLASFYDMFSYVLQQFEAVSFGDSLFSCFILLPLQQCHQLKYRKSVWSEFPAILRTLFIPIKELLLPLPSFMEPEETHPEMLRLYSQALLAGAVRHTWSPIMYTIAVHHLNRFIYNGDTKHKNLQSMVTEQIMHCRNEVLKKHVLFYMKYTEERDLGFTMYEELPSNRQKVLERFTKELSSS